MSHPDFPGAAGYLNTASIGLPPLAVSKAMHAAVDDWSAGRVQAPDYDPYVDRSRAAWARLHGVEPATVAIGPQVSYFAGLVAQALPDGAEVVGFEGDFTSLLFPFLEREGIDVRLVALDRVADAIRDRTTLVAVSAVQSADGRVADLDAIAAAAESHDALTLVDVTQASGWLPVDATRIDFTAGGAYKWLLSPRGTSFMAIRPERAGDLRPIAPGWYAGEQIWESIYGAPLRLAADARRFDLSPAWLSWVGTASALEYVEQAGVEAIQAHDVGLANLLREGLGLPPSDTAMVALAHEGAEEAFHRAGIRAAVRAGSLRVCFHLYNDEADVDAVLRALAA
jgi:selenocysteine lyase/cysteine desulfurase